MQDDEIVTRENKFMHIKYDNFAFYFFFYTFQCMHNLHSQQCYI